MNRLMSLNITVSTLLLNRDSIGKKMGRTTECYAPREEKLALEKLNYSKHQLCQLHTQLFKSVFSYNAK